MYTSKDVENNNIEVQKELFKVVEMTTVDGDTVEVPQSIGVFTKSQLENEKLMTLANIQSLTNNLAEIDEKLKEFI